MQRPLLIATYLALFFLALSIGPISAARSKDGGKKEISPIFRRKPYKSTTEPSSSTTTENESEPGSDGGGGVGVGTSEPEEQNKFRVGAEHYYDNRIDIQKQNDDLDIEIDDSDDGTNYDHTTEYSDYSEDDDEQYYYEDYIEGDPVISDPKPTPDYDSVTKPQTNFRLQRLERLKLMQQRRKYWLQRQREHFYASMSKWRRKRPRVIISEAHEATIRRPSRPSPNVRHPRPDDSNRRHYEAVRGRVDSGESTSFMRSLLGVQPFCIHDEAQFSCTFTPLCWMQGGVAMNGCDSMLYSCCVSHTIARRQDSFVGTGRAQKRQEKDILHNEPECGITRHRQFAKRIIGGQKAKFAELPWQVHIRISSYQCGGVLLNHQYVATAAHCVHQAKLSQITVHLGEFDTKNTQKVREPLGSESFRVEHITLHPDFRYMLTQPDRFDVAVLKLDRPVEYQDNILPICLPAHDVDLVGKVGVVAGWGKTDNSFGKTGTNILHKVLVPIIENNRCRSWHRDKAIQVQLHDEMFCAGHKAGKQDACLGDSGGPLVINFDGRWTLIGITSAGFGCAVEKQPGIYHKVSKTAKWLSQQINQDLLPK